MEDTFVINHIKELCQQRSWTYYKLAKKSNIPYSSLNTLMNKQHVPSMANLIKICNGFGITLSQFFSTMDNPTSEQSELLNVWNVLDDSSKKLALIYMYGLAHQEIPQMSSIYKE